MTEKEKMLAGLAYNAYDEELLSLHRSAEVLQAEFNALPPFDPKRQELLRRFCPGAQEDTYFRGPVYFDYGYFVTFGKGFYANYNCVILDVCPVTIGDNVLFGPNVSLLTPSHPLDYRDRNPGPKGDCEFGDPIVIEDEVWLGGNVVVLGGVRIGKGSVIGAGSVVTKDIPAGVVAVGNPCHVLRPITKEDRMAFHPERYAHK